MIEFRDALTDLLEEFGANDGWYVIIIKYISKNRNTIDKSQFTFRSFKGDLPEERHMKVDNKNFYFDIGQNHRGVYMRISEVSRRIIIILIILIIIFFTRLKTTFALQSQFRKSVGYDFVIFLMTTVTK